MTAGAIAPLCLDDPTTFWGALFCEWNRLGVRSVHLECTRSWKRTAHRVSWVDRDGCWRSTPVPDGAAHQWKQAHRCAGRQGVRLALSFIGREHALEGMAVTRGAHLRHPPVVRYTTPLEFWAWVEATTGLQRAMDALDEVLNAHRSEPAARTRL